MSNFKLTSNQKDKGKVVYNVGILRNIVTIAVAEVEGAMPIQDKKKGVSLYILGDSIYVRVSVAVKAGYNVPDLAYHIQKSVKQSVENMTRYKIAEVDVHVADVVFCDGAVQVKEEPIPEETENKN